MDTGQKPLSLGAITTVRNRTTRSPKSELATCSFFISIKLSHKTLIFQIANSFAHSFKVDLHSLRENGIIELIPGRAGATPIRTRLYRILQIVLTNCT